MSFVIRNTEIKELAGVGSDREVVIAAEQPPSNEMRKRVSTCGNSGFQPLHKHIVLQLL